MAHSIFEKRPKKKYTFADYYKLTCTFDALAAEFGYTTATVESLTLPTGPVNAEALTQLARAYRQAIERVEFTSESGKREMLIAPLLREVADQVKAKLTIEYALDINDKLSGYLDYILHAKPEVVIVEAKRGELEKGFYQLMAELIALDIYEGANPIEQIYGVLTFGNVWQFAVLKRAEKSILREARTYSVPGETEKVFSILVGMLQPASVLS